MSPVSPPAGIREEALAEIVRLVRAHGLGADEINRALESVNAAHAPARQASSVLARVLAYLGGILVLAGLSLFIGLQWEAFTPATRVLVTLGAGFAVYLFAVAATTDPRFERVVTPLMLVAALLQPVGILVLLDEIAAGGEPEHGLLFMCGVMFTQQFLTFLSKRRTVLLFVSLFFGAAGFGTACDLMGAKPDIIMLSLGAGLVLMTMALERTPHRAITPFWYLAGSVLFLSGAFSLLERTRLEIVFFGLAAGVMYLGAVLGSRVMLFVSVLALTGFTGYYFQDSLSNAFGLIILGFLLIGLSAFAMSLNRRFRADAAALDEPADASSEEASP